MKLLVLFLFSPLLHAEPLLLKNAKILQPAQEIVLEGKHLLIQNQRIESVLDHPPSPFSGKVVDLKGKWVIPGLVDTHVHSFGNLGPKKQFQFMGTEGAAKVMLYNGVTAFLDLFADENIILPLRDKQRKEGLLAADIFASGPIFTCTGGHGTEYGLETRVINSPQDAVREITDLAKKKPDVIKIVYDHAYSLMPTMDKSTMEAAVKTAKDVGIPSVVHLGNWKDAKEAILAGANALTHTPGERVVPGDLIKLMVERGVHFIPTLPVQSDLYHFSRNPNLLTHPLLTKTTLPSLLQAYRDLAGWEPHLKSWLEEQKKGWQGNFESVKKLSQAGVPILVGTDAGNAGTFQGYSVHREMELFVQAGLTPWQSLKSATSAAARFLGQRNGAESGDVANLVVLSESPLEKIANTKKIERVIYRGKVVDREQILKYFDRFK